MKHTRPIIVVNKNTPFAYETFSSLGDVRMLDANEVTCESVHDATILIVRSETRVDRTLLEGSDVQFVGTPAIGIDHIDVEYLDSRGIRFANAPGSNASSVAEYVVAALLVWSDRTGTPLRGRTMGIVGVGNVGSKVARAAEVLGLIPLLNDPPRARATQDPVFKPLDQLMDADIITLHVPLIHSGSEATRHLFDAERFARLKQGMVLINTSRGSVVETAALVDALSSGRVSSAIIDVWENEPDIPVDLLQQALIGTAHIAGSSLDGKLNALEAVYNSACRFLQVQPEKVFDDLRKSEEVPLGVSPNVSATTDIVRETVREAYDIELDDCELRRITAIDQSQRASFFSALRSSYRVRREFHTRRVNLLPSQASAAPVLRQLGFRVQ